MRHFMRWLLRLDDKKNGQESKYLDNEHHQLADVRDRLDLIEQQIDRVAQAAVRRTDK